MGPYLNPPNSLYQSQELACLSIQFRAHWNSLSLPLSLFFSLLHARTQTHTVLFLGWLDVNSHVTKTNVNGIIGVELGASNLIGYF
jgi:hypothetical protein